MTRVTRQQAQGELLGLLTRLGFTSTPNVIVFAPEADLTVAKIKSFLRGAELIVRTGESILTPTEIHENKRGLRGAKDFYGVGTVDGERYRFYLVSRIDGTFIDGYLQKIIPSLPGKITLEERHH